jgi:hypothetical protein
MENRSGLVVSAVVSHADGFGERNAALAMLDTMPTTTSRRSVGADKAYDTADFVAGCRERKVTPHVAANDTRRGGSAIDGRTTPIDGRPRFVKRSLNDGEKVKIAAIDPDFV